MAVMDEFKEERAAMKNGTPKEKISYFILYYKWYVIVPVLALIVIITTIVQIVTKKDTALYVCMLNSAEQVTGGLGTESVSALEHAARFVEYAGINTEEYEVHIDTGMRIHPDSMDDTTVASSQKFMAYLAAAEMDVMVTDEVSMEQYANKNDFYDLREILTPEQLAAYEPYFYYIDQTAADAREEFLSNPDNLYAKEIPAVPDPRDPSVMDKPIPVGIYVSDCAELKDNFLYETNDIVLGIFGNSPHLDNALQYLTFLTETK